MKVTGIRSLNVPQSLSVTRVCNYVLGKTDPLLPKPVREEWYAKSDEICLVPSCIKRAIALDMAFIVTRDQDDERIGWTTFNQGISTDELEVTSVGFMPLILNPAHELITILTVLTRYISIADQLKQKFVILTVDQDFYCKLIELKGEYYRSNTF